MHQLDTLIERFAAGRITRRGLVKGAAALGVAARRCRRWSAATSSSRSRPRTRSLGLAARHARRPRRLRLLGRRQDGLLRRHRDDPRAGPIEATAGTKAVDTGQADMAYPSPGVFSLMIEQGIPLVSVFEMGAYDVFDFAFQKGQAPASVKDLEGKTVVLGRPAGRASSTRRSLRPAAIHTMVKYVDAGPQWGQTLAQGRPTPRSPGRGCAPSGRPSGSTSTTSWARTGRSSRPTRSSSAARTSRMRRWPTSTAATSAAGRGAGVRLPQPGRRDPDHLRGAAAALNEVFEDKQIAVESMWQLADVFRGDWADARGLGLALRRGLGPLPQDHVRDRPAHRGADGGRRDDATTGSPPPTTSTTTRSRRGGDRLRADRGLRLADAARRRRRV